MRKLLVTMASAMMVMSLSTPILIEDAGAKGFSSRSSSFSRSSSRSSSWGSKSSSSRKTSGGFWGSSKKSSTKTKTKPAKTTNKSTGFASNKTGNKSLKTGGKKTGLNSKGSSKKTKQVLNNKRQQAKFKKPTSIPGVKGSNGKRPSKIATNNHYRKQYNKNPVYSNARNNNRDTYYSRRDGYYGGGYQPPMYVYNSAPSFGMWDTIFLYHMMSSANAGAFAHNHQNDPDFQNWKKQAEMEARENAELKAQLNAMNSGALEMQGTPIQEGYLPEGVDADIALAQSALGSLMPDFKVATGSKNGAYFLATAGVISPNVDNVNVIPVVTEGTKAALACVASGKCDAAFVQADGYWNYVEDHKTTDLPFSRIMSPFKEAVHMICHKDGPSSVSDMDDDNRIWFPAMSGAATTYRNWIGEDDDYEDIKTVLTDDAMIAADLHTYEQALAKVNETDCAMYVGAPGTKFMRNVEASAKASGFVLVDVNDGDLDDTEDPSGRDVYNTGQIDSAKYPNLLSQNGVTFGSGDLDTTWMNADVIVSTAFQKKHAKVYPDLKLQITALQDQIQKVVNN